MGRRKKKVMDELVDGGAIMGGVVRSDAIPTSFAGQITDRTILGQNNIKRSMVCPHCEGSGFFDRVKDIGRVALDNKKLIGTVGSIGLKATGNDTAADVLKAATGAGFNLGNVLRRGFERAGSELGGVAQKAITEVGNNRQSIGQAAKLAGTVATLAGAPEVGIPLGVAGTVASGGRLPFFMDKDFTKGVKRAFEPSTKRLYDNRKLLAGIAAPLLSASGHDTAAQIATNVGGSGLKRFVKGSQEAKDHMAKLRAMRKGGKRKTVAAEGGSFVPY